MNNNRPQYYAIYLRGSDTLVCCGDKYECAAAMGMTITTFMSTLSHVRSGINRKYEFYQEDLEVESCD